MLSSPRLRTAIFRWLAPIFLTRSVPLKIRRRDLVKNLVLASGAAALAPSWPFGEATSARAGLPDLPSPGNSQIDHVVVVTMENRSFDHFLGWLPNADGKQEGLTFNNTSGEPQNTARLTNFQNC